MTKVVIRVGKATDSLKKFAVENPTYFQQIHANQITGESAEFIALVTLTGITVKSISDLIIAHLSLHKDIQISCKGVTVKGLNKDSALEIISKLAEEPSNGDNPQ